MKLNKHQAGRSLVAMIALIGLFGYVTYIGIKIIPVYTDFFSIRSAVDSLAEDMRSQQLDKSKYMEFLGKRLDMNFIDMHVLKPQRDGGDKTKKDVFSYQRGRESIELGIHYEVRVPIMANIDALLSFNHATSVPLNAR